ncbi:MAG TPA: hypothetical protein VMV14_02555, partial [Acidimicrobiales bacterium]|nr:hypothetical protein [Acidimicrobiales bacterium]
LAHLDSWGTAAAAGVLAVLANNLPAASVLAARHPPHPFALLVGLDLGPNLFLTGSLSSLLWWQAAKLAGAHPSARRASRLGLISVPLAMAGAVGVLTMTGAH